MSTHRLASSSMTLLCLLAAPGDAPAQEEVSFLRGDANADGRVSISDALTVSRTLFLGDLPPSCRDAADINDDEIVNISDSVKILWSIFRGEDHIQPPFPAAGPDPTPTGPEPAPAVLDCGSYEVQPAESTGDRVRIGDVTAAPGESVEIPVYLTSSVDVEAVQLVVRYDPDAFTPFIPCDRVYPCSVEPLLFEGTPWDEPLEVGFQSVTVFEGEGIFLVGVAGMFEPPWPLFPPIPPGKDQLVFKIQGTVPAGAPAGTVLLEPTSGPDGQGVLPPYLLRNEITHRGEARYASILPETVPGLLNIVVDVTFFRGDANSDREVDISDAVFVLDFLFLGDAKPACPDAADADDSGTIDITDPIVILNHLFTGRSAIALPHPSRGPDPSRDDLAACERD
jgi:hypothetical protein